MRLRAHINYLNFSDELHYLKKETDLEEVAKFFKSMNYFQKEFYFFRDHAFFIIDYSKRKHVLMSGPIFDCLGHHPRDLIDGGLDFLVDIFQKDDFAILNQKVFPSTASFLQEQPQLEHDTFVFETNYRLFDTNNKSLAILQKGSYITDTQTKLPVYSFGIVLNITNVKRDSTMVQVIGKYKQDGNKTNYQHFSTNYFYPDIETSLLTKKEKEVLLWIAEGYSSKQIADRMKLSENTISNHRKNMMRKSNTKNAAELIRFAFTNKII